MHCHLSKFDRGRIQQLKKLDEGTDDESDSTPESASENETFALDKIKWFSIFELAGLLLTFVFPWFFGVGAFTSFVSSITSFSENYAESGALSLAVLASILIGLFLGLIATGLARSGFKSLSEVDRRFSACSTLSISLLAGLFFGFLGILLYILIGAQVSHALAVRSTEQVSSQFYQIIGGEFTLGTVAILIGVLAALIGGIGIVVGLWRMGERFDQSILKVGAILQVIPFLSIFGSVLAFIGANSADSS